MDTELEFYLLAGMVGMVQGGVQALSRSLFATMIPRAKSSEFFGLFAVFDRFAGIIGPLMFAVVTDVTGSGQNAVLAIIAFFVIGGLLLAKVNVREGQAAARAADERALETGSV
jgi:UMF1 family MFS transporter